MHSRNAILPVLASLAIVIFLSAIMIAWGDWQDFSASVRAIGLEVILLALLTSLCNYSLRFARWSAFLHALHHCIPWSQNFAIYLSGLAMTGTPAKAGELVRGIFLKPRGVPYAQSVTLFYWDRLSDLAGVLLLAAGAGAMAADQGVARMFMVVALAGMLWLARPGGGIATAIFLWVARRGRGRARRMARALFRLREMDRKITLPLAAGAVLAGGVAYGAHGLGLFLLANAAGQPLALHGAILIVALSTLAGAAAMLPAGGGVVEITSVGLLMASGIPKADAVAIGLLHRAATFWFALAIGGVCLAFQIGLFSRGK